jgi:16S rRNA (guanine966-N2)-methyltransferase
MRIIAGSRKGFAIKLQCVAGVRPVTDRIKESVFGIISDKLDGAEVLDLFAGAGSFGLEALSRGAAEAVFVDFSPACASSIKENLKFMKFEGDVLCLDAFEALEKLYVRGRKFDLIFIDPPFKNGREDIIKAVNLISDKRLLPMGAFAVARCHFKTVLPGSLGFLDCVREKRYGENKVLFYAYGGGSES